MFINVKRAVLIISSQLHL